VATLQASTMTENHGNPALVQESALRGTAERECNGDPHTHRRQSAEQARLCPRTCFPHPRRAYTRRSWPDVRLCIAKVVFRRQTFAPRHKSGGRKPPVVCSRNANPITAIRRIAVAEAVCNPTAG
jgi:hypothetical protein